MNDLCAGMVELVATRARLLGWLAEGAREVAWALCTLPRERWTVAPDAALAPWPALRHARYLGLRDQLVTLPAVRRHLGDAEAAPASSVEFEQAEAAWDPNIEVDSAQEVLRGLGGARFDLLRHLEAAPEAAWGDVEWSTGQVGRPPWLIALLLSARQQELEHLAAMWRIALFWDRVSPTSLREAQAGSVSLPLHPADTA
ncbi:MAG TPA: hypothetical protein VFB50_03340 [Chloroflexota bacterium]|nr:hypothetical protein [Chloroflexota bacterium]